jgi:hypothetical protein
MAVGHVAHRAIPRTVARPGSTNTVPGRLSLTRRMRRSDPPLYNPAPSATGTTDSGVGDG